MAQTVLGWLAGWLAGVTLAISSILTTACTEPPQDNSVTAVAHQGITTDAGIAPSLTTRPSPAIETMPPSLEDLTIREIESQTRALKTDASSYSDLTKEQRARIDLLTRARAAKRHVAAAEHRRAVSPADIYPGVAVSPDKEPVDRGTP